jgi:site-specific recombinase XerD
LQPTGGRALETAPAFFSPMNDLESIAETVKHFTRAARSPNTMKAYAADCRIFAEWCRTRGFDSFPTAPATVAAFVAHQADAGASSIATISRRLAAIARVHRVKGWASPIDDSVRDVLSGARRQAGQTAKPSRPLVVEDVRTIIEHIEQGSLIGARDRALILVGFAGALRRSELRALRCENIEQRSAGLILTIERSKTDQTAKGQTIALLRGSCAALDACAALSVWLVRASITSGFVFRAVDDRRDSPVSGHPLSDCAINKIIKRRARLAGLDSTNVSAHSLRSGALTSGAMAGANVHKLKELSRHASLSSLSRYIRPQEIFEDHALKGVL